MSTYTKQNLNNGWYVNKLLFYRILASIPAKSLVLEAYCGPWCACYTSDDVLMAPLFLLCFKIIALQSWNDKQIRNKRELERVLINSPEKL